MVAVLTALLVICRLAMPIRPPLKKPDIPEEPVPCALAAADPVRPKPRPPPMTIEIVRMAIMASPSSEPPVCPTFTPRDARKLSIF